MYSVKDLFDKRSVFGARLEQFMDSHHITKAKLCKDAEISRPTLDKLLSAEITNGTNFEKHAVKILDALHITADILMGNSHNVYNQMRTLKNMLHISEDALSAASGISISRLRDIEAGEEATISELRDIALCCKTSVRGLLGTYYFDIPLSTIGVYDFSTSTKVPGFWGHIGILTASNDNYLWYPISSDVKAHLYYILDQKFIVVPCMNNKVLFLNMNYINNILLLDDACSEPSFTNWDPLVSEGEIPLVIYEALNDFIDIDPEINSNVEDTAMSSRFLKLIKELVSKEQWTTDDILWLLNGITVYFNNSKCISTMINSDDSETFTCAIQSAYEFGELQQDDLIVRFFDSDGMEVILNLNNISMIEAPLLAIENIICQDMDRFIENNNS